jgi:soluble lytic murein transglycosylase-like protein
LSYSIQPNGTILLDGKLLSLGGEYAAFVSRVQTRWGDIAKKHAARTGVDARLILATIYVESGGNPLAVSNDPGGTHGYGLMQITAEILKKGHSNEELLNDPDLNVSLGTDALAYIIKTEGNPADIPRINSAYNCGAPYPRSNAWGLCGYPGYLDRICATWNDQVLRTPAAPQRPSTFTKIAGIGLALWGAKKLFLG